MPDPRWLTFDPDAGDLTDIEPYWPNVHEVPLEALGPLLEAAARQCEEFAPALPEPPAELPAGYLTAQGMQARALWRSGTVGSNDQFGGGEYTVTVFPMDWTVKALLRPKRGRPVIA